MEQTQHGTNLELVRFAKSQCKFLFLLLCGPHCVTCRPFAEKYAADESAFFSDYALAHAKLSELGVKWAPGAPVTIE
jgi:hypothetical protein